MAGMYSDGTTTTFLNWNDYSYTHYMRYYLQAEREWWLFPPISSLKPFISILKICNCLSSFTIRISNPPLTQCFFSPFVRFIPSMTNYRCCADKFQTWQRSTNTMDHGAKSIASTTETKAKRKSEIIWHHQNGIYRNDTTTTKNNHDNKWMKCLIETKAKTKDPLETKYSNNNKQQQAAAAEVAAIIIASIL